MSEYGANFPTSDDDESEETFQEQNEKLESFGQLIWYFALVEKTREFKSRPLEEWPLVELSNPEVGWRYSDEAFDDQGESMEENGDVVQRANGFHKVEELLKTVRAARLDKSRFLEWCPDADPRSEIVDALWFHVDRVMEELQAMRNCITNTLDTFIRDADLTSTSAGEGVVLPGPVDETWMSSLLIPSDLKTVFVSQVAVLENVPEEKKDWHPESNNQVLDLVHPSLYCCVFGTTKRVPASEIDSNVDLTVVERMERTAFKATEVTCRTSSSDNYQWIPSDFAVDESGHVKILSYINNLHPVTHAAMYDSIAAIFKRFVSLFDQVLTDLVAEYYKQPCPFRVPDMSETRVDCTNYLPERLPIPDRIPLKSGCPWSYSLKGTTVQVIVTIAEIHLTPEKPKYLGGSWHIEGTGSEEIVATGIYYFGSENITDSKLSFRVIVVEPLHVTDDTTWISASLIALELKTAFVNQVAVLEDVPEREKDWHPGSDNQVLDLVHPSLFCCVYGETKRFAETETLDSTDEMSALRRMETIAFKATSAVDTPEYSGDQYEMDDENQWIPSDFAVDDDGHVKILSYINNLHPGDHAAMYESIAGIFERFVPMFDRVLSGLTGECHEPHAIEIPALKKHAEYLPEISVPGVFPLEPDYETAYTLKGTTVQVIVKIAEIHLTPEKPSYSGGSWHIEGTEAEQIVATGLYYFGCENITESKLSFRAIVSEPDLEDTSRFYLAALYGLERHELLTQSLGAATAIEDRCFVFLNTLQHKLEPFELIDATKPGVRKILAFFVVNPSNRIPSSSVIPPQQKDWLQRALPPMLEAKNLPVAALGGKLTQLLGDGMTLDEAKAHREKLMTARRTYNAFEKQQELRFSLCEH
ncbi:hypothetical protein Poli38472_013526 [Pythium oligandrum]|uniref:DUF4246 domain-containing protein n=1 Tax=Pythium oligandrum TaxID=41045 RepID=A0A8K1FFV7_PYTOL|nr:hypothetical protein Poli38472_013526 [Pythium oligandrum]|eukprot:TMW58052.1 hypothetical protein Poli38472_013526 [Pythium oligandrum]